MAEPQEEDRQFYAAAVNAWFSTRMEHDRSLLALSAGAIGLLVTLLSTVGARSVESVALYICALLSFLTCVGCVLWVLKRNATYLEKIVNENAKSDPVLRTLDRAAFCSFFLGALLSAIIGITAAVQSLKPEEIDMSVDDKHHARPGQDSSKKSFDGASNLRPKPVETPTQQPASNPDTQSPAPAKPDGNENR